jgi:hypothetical protein
LTIGIGGWFYAGHWMIGLLWIAIMFGAFLSIFAGIGIILFPVLWFMSVIAAWGWVRRSALEQAIWSAIARSEEARYQERLGGQGNVAPS